MSVFVNVEAESKNGHCCDVFQVYKPGQRITVQILTNTYSIYFMQSARTAA